MAKYNFDKNLIKASYKKDLYGAKREWEKICKETRENQDGLCICQRKVKNIIYMYNPKTKLTIIVGSTCAKKFELNDAPQLPNNILKKILSKSLEKGNYEIIDNIIKYSNNIEDEIIKYYNDKIIYFENIYFEKKNNYSSQNLIKINNEIKDLIDTYSLKYLDKIYENLNIKLKKNIVHKELIERFLVYSVKTFTRNYIPGLGSNIYESTTFFRDIDECNNYISTIKPIGFIKKYYNGCTITEDTITKIEIKHNENIIIILTIKQYIEQFKNKKYDEEMENKLEQKKKPTFACHTCKITNICKYDIHKNNIYKVDKYNYVCLQCNNCDVCKKKNLL